MTARLATAVADPHLVDLVDAVVAAIDLDRSWEIERLRTALDAFGVGELFAVELRLNGARSTDVCGCCGQEGWL